MAVTGSPGRPDEDVRRMIGRALEELRAQSDRRWAEVHPRVRVRALQVSGRRAGRPVGAVRAQAPGGAVAVALGVLVAELAEALQQAPDLELRDVLLDLSRDDRLTGVTLVVAAVHPPGAGPGPGLEPGPEPLPDKATGLRRLAADRLRQVLGPVLPEPVEELVRVRVEDLVVRDPRGLRRRHPPGKPPAGQPPTGQPQT